MTEQIADFIEKQSCASICCIDEEGKPYCFSCYYAFDTATLQLYFKSSRESKHAALLKHNPNIAGTILPDKLNKLLVKGAQFEGTILDPDNPMVKQSLALYHKKYPMALAFPGETWTIQLNHIKLTDSSFGFGKKISWQRMPAI